MTFKLTINMDGAAFQDPYTGEADNLSAAIELNRILGKVMQGFKQRWPQGFPAGTSGSLMDINGNKVGGYKFEEE